MCHLWSDLFVWLCKIRMTRPKLQYGFGRLMSSGLWIRVASTSSQHSTEQFGVARLASAEGPSLAALVCSPPLLAAIPFAVGATVCVQYILSSSGQVTCCTTLPAQIIPVWRSFGCHAILGNGLLVSFILLWPDSCKEDGTEISNVWSCGRGVKVFKAPLLLVLHLYSH